MKTIQILILLAICTYTYSAAAGEACTADGTTACDAKLCCNSGLKCESMLTGTVYTQTRTSKTVHTCVALDPTKCAQTSGDYMADTPAKALCKDSATKECKAVASSFTVGIASATDFTCTAITDKTTCVDPTSFIVTTISAQTETDPTKILCLDSSTKACNKLQATAGTWAYGFKAANDYTCSAPTATTKSSATCVDPTTKLTITPAATQCVLETYLGCEQLAYANTLARYTKATNELTCTATTTATALCNSKVCGLGECCSSSACTKASATQCLKSATEVACNPIGTQVYSVSGDASCVESSTLTANTQCFDSTTKVIATLTSTSTKCVNTDKTCADLKDSANVAKYTQTSTTDFTCVAVATTTTTTTTTFGNQINYILGSIFIIISLILI